ncbi:MAG TPA: hypothetical protein PKU95_01125 [Candidatus Dojkabacteria bacterium]|jgi:hypothetical protein|nr:hypothetical protein [Candidatus Dojkabacteria bacterium]
MSTIVKDKNFNDILRGFLATGIIFLLILIGLLLKQGFSATDVLPVIVNPTPVPGSNEPESTPTPQPVKEEEIFIGQRIPGTVEELTLKADPQTSLDSVWLIRMRFENASIISVYSLKGMLLPACENQKTFTDDLICADLAWNSPFLAGEETVKIKVQWGVDGRIYRLDTDAYYNGEDLSINNFKYYPQVAGATTDTQISFTPSALILLSIGCVLIFSAGVGIFIVQKEARNKEVASRISRTIVLSGMALLAVGSVVAAALFTSEDQNDQGAVLSPETEYVYIYISPTALPTQGLTLTPTSTITNTPTPTQYPNFLIVYVSSSPVPVVATATPTPSPTITPTLPFTDNIYITCGLIDVNSDSKLDHIDQPQFMSAYNKICIDTPPAVGCGGKDVNADSTINYIDLYYFLDNYYPKTLDCTIY